MSAITIRPCLRTCCSRWKSVSRQRSSNKRSISLSHQLMLPKDETPETSTESKSTLIAELHARGLVHNMTTTAKTLDKEVETTKITAYCGVDPTADSLHLGNLLTLMPLIHLFTRGHTVIPLIGGFTCKVGDPSGRLSDREPMPAEVAAKNISKMTAQLKLLFQNARSYAVSRGFKESDFGKVGIINNDVWWKDFKLSDFLTKVAQYMRLGPMIARDSVKSRLLSREGIDAASFLYQSLQAYDFLHLYQTKKCQLQVGGSDQWGNILAGIDLCQKVDASANESKRNFSLMRDVLIREVDTYGLTVPLLLSPSGEKFGKSAGNALFLDSTYTHPFDLYQYFLRTSDEHAEHYLKLFTLLPIHGINEIFQEHVKTPKKRVAQRILAENVVTLVHGADVVQRCIFQTAALYPAHSGDYKSETILQAFHGDSTMVKKFTHNSVTDVPLSQLLKLIGIVKSNSHFPSHYLSDANIVGEGLRAMRNGGVYVNGVQRKNIDATVQSIPLLDDKLLVIRHGRSNFKIVEILNDEGKGYSSL